MVLPYLDASMPGKATADSSLVEARFIDIIPGVWVVQAVNSLLMSPTLGALMTMSWEVPATDSGTRVSIRADEVPAGISAEATWPGSRPLANVATHVQR